MSNITYKLNRSPEFELVGTTVVSGTVHMYDSVQVI